MPTATTVPAKRRKRPRHCPECGADMIERHRAAKFCRIACRDAFNNREKERGAVLYRFKMEERYRRSGKRAGDLQSIMNRLCAQWHREDERARHGRPSWSDPWAWLERNPWAKPSMGLAAHMPIDPSDRKVSWAPGQAPGLKR